MLCRSIAAQLMSLEDDSLVSDTAGNSLLVKVFQQWDSVFPGHAEQVFKACDIDFWRLGLLRGHDLSQGLECGLVKDQIVRQFNKHAVAKQERYQLLRARLVNGKIFEHFFHQRNFEAGID